MPGNWEDYAASAHDRPDPGARPSRAGTCAESSALPSVSGGGDLTDGRIDFEAQLEPSRSGAPPFGAAVLRGVSLALADQLQASAVQDPVHRSAAAGSGRRLPTGEGAAAAGRDRVIGYRQLVPETSTRHGAHGRLERSFQFVAEAQRDPRLEPSALVALLVADAVACPSPLKVRTLLEADPSGLQRPEITLASARARRRASVPAGQLPLCQHGLCAAPAFARGHAASPPIWPGPIPAPGVGRRHRVGGRGQHGQLQLRAPHGVTPPSRDRDPKGGRNVHYSSIFPASLRC